MLETFVAAYRADKALQKAIYAGVGFPIRISADQCSFANSPQLFAGCHVLHRL